MATKRSSTTKKSKSRAATTAKKAPVSKGRPSKQGLGATLPADTIGRRKTNHHLDIVLRRGRVMNEYGNIVMRW